LEIAIGTISYTKLSDVERLRIGHQKEYFLLFLKKMSSCLIFPAIDVAQTAERWRCIER